MLEIGTIYNFDGQPARVTGPARSLIEVYLGGGRWQEYDDPSDSFAFASPLSSEEGAELIVAWDAAGPKADPKADPKAFGAGI